MSKNNKTVLFLFINGPHHVYHLILPALRFSALKNEIETIFKSGNPLNTKIINYTKKITGLPTITVGSVGLESDFIGFYQGEDEVKSAPIDDLVKRMDDMEFDMVAVGRALLSDPEWVNKVKEGRYDEVIPFSKKHAENYY